MEINLELYKIFYVVANTGSITKAAGELFITQPAISKAIKNLEERLGGTLFFRTKHGVVLTEEGKEFYKYISQALNLITNGESKFSNLINLECGSIRIGASTTLTKEILMPYLNQFHKLYPKIEIKIYTNLTLDLIEMLKTGLLDLVILNLPYDTNNDLIIKKIKNVQDVFFASNNYKELNNRKVSIQELINYPLILQLKKSNTRSFLDQYLKLNNVIANPVMELSSYALVNEFTKNGFGIGYGTLEYMNKRDLDNDLFVIDLEPKIPTRSIGIAYSNKNLPSFSTNKLIELICQNDK